MKTNSHNLRNPLFLFLKVIMFTPLLLLLVTVNYISDPAGLFGETEKEAKLAELLAEKRNACIISNYNERLLQKLYIESISESPDIIVLGSSRSMQISQDQFTDRTLFNNCVSNGVIQDYISIIQIYRDCGFKPSTVIIGIDPWVLNKNNNISRWQQFQSEYKKALYRISSNKAASILKLPRINQKYLMLLSPSYFQNSIRFLVNKPEKKNFFYEAKNLDSDVSIKRADGSLLPGRADREKSEETVLLDALSAVSDYRLAKFIKPDRQLLEILDDLVVSLQNDKINVIFFLPPYHPVTYKMMMESKSYKIVASVEDSIRTLAIKRNVKVLGSYNPITCSLDGSDFYDRYHPRREAIARIFKAEK
jgi:hypothetical protein